MKKYRQLMFVFVVACIILNLNSANASPITAGEVGLGGVIKAIGLAADLITLFGIADNNSPSNTLSITTSGSEKAFSLTLRGGDIDDTAQLRFTGNVSGQVTTAGGGTAQAKFWSWELLVTSSSVQDTLTFNETLLISGHVQHEIGPDAGDDPQGPQLNFSVNVNADNATNMMVIGNTDAGDLMPVAHPGIPHTDQLTLARLKANTDSFLNFDEILDFTFQTKAEHCAKAPPQQRQGLVINQEEVCPACVGDACVIPEPSTYLLFGTGLLGILGYAWRRRKLNG